MAKLALGMNDVMIRVFLGIFLVATKRLYKSVCPSVGPWVGPYVMLLLFGLLGATNAVYTALFYKIRTIAIAIARMCGIQEN